MSLRTTYFLFLFFLSWFTFSQPTNLAKTSLEDANEHFSHKNYLMAIPIYKNELKKDWDNVKIKYRLGVCFLNTKINRQESVKYLEEYTKDPKCEEEAWIELGRAYHVTNKIDKAIDCFNKFATLKPKRADEVAHYLEQCTNAKVLMSMPSNVTFQNLGKEINSDEPDYYPFVSAEENFLAFTSRRKDGIGGKKVEMDGYHPSDVYYSKLENGKWTKAVNAGRFINTALDEQVVGLKPDGTEMYVYLDHIDKFGDLYISQRKDLNVDFPKPKICEPVINEKIETSGCLSSDGQLMIFARRDKVDDKSDLYMCRRLPNGKWSLAQRLPDLINTKYNEDFPYLGADGVTLYFASEGHNSMGGFDLFKTVWNPETNEYTKPENLGYPINSTDDDRNICITPDNRVGYVSAFRPGGFGDMDIYRIKFNENALISRIILGKIFLNDSTATQPKPFEITIIAKNLANKEELLYAPHSKTGKYVMNLTAGKYEITITSDGFAELKDEITIPDIGKLEMEKNRNYVLKKLNN